MIYLRGCPQKVKLFSNTIAFFEALTKRREQDPRNKTLNR